MTIREAVLGIVAELIYWKNHGEGLLVSLFWGTRK